MKTNTPVRGFVEDEILARAIEVAAELDIELPLRLFDLNDLSPEQGLALFYTDPACRVPAMVGGLLYIFPGTGKDLVHYLGNHDEQRLRALVGKSAKLRLVK